LGVYPHIPKTDIPKRRKSPCLKGLRHLQTFK
jgi:hypothetical protein